MNKWTPLILLILVAVVISAVALLFGDVQFRDSQPRFGLDGTVNGETPYRISMVNESEYTISRGVLVVHDGDFSMNFLGQIAPTAYESLAEVGDPFAVIAAIVGSPGVYQVIQTEELSSGGEIDMIVHGAGWDDAAVSYMAMIVETNDGVVWLNGASLYADANTKSLNGFWAEILDMGTEENSPINSGFAGGQPDPSRGAENIDNGVPTQNAVSHHSQFLDDLFLMRFDFLPTWRVMVPEGGVAESEPESQSF